MGGTSGKYDILTVQEKQWAHRDNKKKDKPWNESTAKRERGIMAEDDQNTYEETYWDWKKLLSDIGGKGMFVIMTGEA